MDDTWFDLVPLALLEFNEHGRVLRGVHDEGRRAGHRGSRLTLGTAPSGRGLAKRHASPLHCTSPLPPHPD